VRLTAYRITLEKYAATAFDGEGARLHGGRWNTPGRRLVYVASSISLATLEMLVHLENPAILQRRFVIIPVTMPEECVERLAGKRLPAGWDGPEIHHGTQALGDGWLAGGTSLALAVPIAIVPSELNYLLNPAHPDFSRLKIGEPVPMRLDPRLAR